MNMNMRTTLAGGTWVVATLLAIGPANGQAPLPSIDAPDLARGPYSTMHMLLEKTILNIKVATIDVRVDKATQAKLAGFAKDKSYSEALSHQLAGAAYGAGRAVVQMQFVRDIPFNRWLGVVKDNVVQGLPQWFAAIKKRGYEKGDKLIYSVTPDAVRSVVVAANGQVHVDTVEKDSSGRRVVLGSYFAPGSEFREPLLRSLFGGR
jgi:hypothetical protein